MRGFLLAGILMGTSMLLSLPAEATTNRALQTLQTAAETTSLVEPAACVRRRVCGPRGCVWRTVCGRRRW
jgi:hypothetical protein